MTIPVSTHTVNMRCFLSQQLGENPMTRSILFCVFALAACGDNLTPEASQDAGPDYDAAPDATPAPEADGEYVVKVSPISFLCYDEPQQTNEFYTLADLVPQEDPWKFDLLSTGLQSTFVYFTGYSTPWDQDGGGHFSANHVNAVSFGEGIDIKAKRFIDGIANGYGLGFYHSYDLGMDLEDGSWESFCVYEADISGTRRYMPWDSAPRTSIDGQWRVKETVVASPLFLPQNLPYTHFVTMDTVVQNADGSTFDLPGVYDPGYYATRNSVSGAVNNSITTDVPGNGETTRYETHLWGTLLPNQMDLNYTWRWSIVETGEELWFTQEHYEGTPRYNPHNLKLPEPPEGAYNAEYRLMENDCGNTPYTQHRVLDVWQKDDGAVWPKITGFNIEPDVRLGPNGELTMAFIRYTNSGEFYNYSFENSTINGHAVDLNMTVEVTSNGAHACTAKYKITGPKRYESYR